MGGFAACRGEPTGSPDAPHPDRDTFDRTIASLLLDDKPVGSVAFKLNRQVSRTSGHLWWTKRSVPVDVVMWIDVLMPGSPGESMQDGISAVGGLTDHVLAGAWEVNPARLRGIAVQDDAGAMLRLRFLTGDEKARAWRQFGLGDD